MHNVLIVVHPDNYSEAQIISTHLKSLRVYEPTLLHVALAHMDTISVKNIVDNSIAVIVLDHEALYGDTLVNATLYLAQKTVGKLALVTVTGSFSTPIDQGSFNGSTLDFTRPNFINGLEIFLLGNIYS